MLRCMVPYFCYHLSDNHVDLSDLYVVLPDLYVDLSDFYVDLSLIHLLEKNLENVFLPILCHTDNNQMNWQVDITSDKSTLYIYHKAWHPEYQPRGDTKALVSYGTEGLIYGKVAREDM